MSIENLFRILLDEQEVEIYSHKLHRSLWNGEVKDIPNCYFDNVVSSLYSLNDSYDSYIRINIIE